MIASSKSLRHLSKLFAVLLLEVVLILGFLVPAQSQTRSVSKWVSQGLEWIEKWVGKTPKVETVSRTQRLTHQQAVEKTERSGGGLSAVGGLYYSHELPTSALFAKPLSALIPKGEVALTLAERPTFFFYIPETPAPVEFTLLHNGDVFYRSTFTVTGPPGIIILKLPTDKSALEVGKEYQWYFSVFPDSKDLVLKGWVKRIEPSPTLVTELENATPQVRPAIYASAGIWHDTVTSLAELRYSSPNDSKLLTRWTKLLQAVELDAIAQEPLVGCVNCR